MKRSGIVHFAFGGLVSSSLSSCTSSLDNDALAPQSASASISADATNSSRASMLSGGISSAGSVAKSATVTVEPSPRSSSASGTSGTGAVSPSSSLSSANGVRAVNSTDPIASVAHGAPTAAGNEVPSAATANSVTSGVATPPSGDPIPSTGCGTTSTPMACDTQNAPCTKDINGKERKYWVQLPEKYDAKRPYPVVFQYHPLGGNGWQGLTMYQLRPKFPDAIYVSPDGLKSGQYQGFSNTDAEDETLTRAMMAELEGKYCVDKARYFATGFSFGGSMSYTAACNMSDVFRAIGAMSGAPISGAKCTSKKPGRPVAVWATHGDMDTALPITMAEPLIEALVKYNGCSSETKPVDPSPCVEYQNCTEGYPVIWCVRPGDTHGIPSFGGTAIAKFFQQF